MPSKILSSVSIADGLPVKAYQGDCERLATAVARQGRGVEHCTMSIIHTRLRTLQLMN